MPDRTPALRCDIDGQARLLPAAAVRLVSLRLPVSNDDQGAWVELNGRRWPVANRRERPDSTSDHFVFLGTGEGRRVVVVDRVVDLVDAPDSGAFAWLEARP